MDVSRTILSIEKGLDSLEIAEQEEEYGAEAEEQYEDSEVALDDMPVPARPIPRRASLANDTQGGPLL
jgi:hypothetical protein